MPIRSYTLGDSTIASAAERLAYFDASLTAARAELATAPSRVLLGFAAVFFAVAVWRFRYE